ncbi:MAG: hypothetical protein IPP32_12770 [Bacteroidetes bacterium]|nr:hypothetical protein [Bacteroidota bacterium]
MALDKSNNVFLSGGFTNTIDFDPDTGIYNLVSSGNNDIYVLKLNSNGIFKWAHRFGSTGWDYTTTIVIDKSNRIWLTGAFENQIDFDPGAGVFNLTATGTVNNFIEKLDTAGNFIWAGKIAATGSTNLVSQNRP